VAAALPWWRGGAAAAVVSDFGGEKDGEREQIVEELTADRFCAEETSERIVDEEGGAQQRTAMAAVVCGLDSARIGRDRGRERVEWFRGEVARLWARRNEV
jgi:hypothetical protein